MPLTGQQNVECCALFPDEKRVLTGSLDHSLQVWDLTEFAEKHPGGAQWIRLTEGTDITEAFEVAHVFKGNAMEKLLAKYKVKNCAEIPRKSPFTFAENGFYQTLKRRAQKVLKEVGTGPTWQMTLLGKYFT